MESISGNALVIKEININLVRKALKVKGLATKQQIAKATGLSLVTVGTVLQFLLKQNEVFASELSPSSGGRPAQQYRYNSDFAFALVLFPYESTGRITIHSAVVNLSAQCVYESDTEVENIDFKCFEEIIEPLLAAYPAIRVLGFGHPGIEDEGKIILSDYKMLIGSPFTEHFSTLYGMPVVMENDVNCAVTGFAKRKKLLEDCTLVYLYFPDLYQPGAGIFINGRLFKGKRNFAGEVGSLPFDLAWGKDLYASFDPLCEAIYTLILTICCILDPDRVVLNGSFLTQDHIAAITRKCREGLPRNIVPVISLSDNFVSDYQNGLAAQTLEQLEPDIRLTRTKC